MSIMQWIPMSRTKTMSKHLETAQNLKDKLLEAENILLFPHIGIDGDAVGSCCALIWALRKKGKNAYALYEEDMPGNLMFLTDDPEGKPCFTSDRDIISDDDLDVAMAVDCGELKRFPAYRDKFLGAPVKLVLDHHGTSLKEPLGDFNMIDPDAAAAGVLMYWLLSLIEGAVTDRYIGQCLFSAIVTDTGRFQYSNTNRECWEIMSELSSWGCDFVRASTELYESKREEQVRITAYAINKMTVSEDGRWAVTTLSKEELDAMGVRAGETDEIVGEMRSVKGVEVSVFLREVENNVIRVSYRSKYFVDVASLASKHGGGGHLRAAGATLYMSLAEAERIILDDLKNYFSN